MLASIRSAMCVLCEFAFAMPANISSISPGRSAGSWLMFLGQGITHRSFDKMIKGLRFAWLCNCHRGFFQQDAENWFGHLHNTLGCFQASAHGVEMKVWARQFDSKVSTEIPLSYLKLDCTPRMEGSVWQNQDREKQARHHDPPCFGFSDTLKGSRNSDVLRLRPQHSTITKQTLYPGVFLQ